MNLWRCNAIGCDSTAVGTGGAVGLRAIGWWFKRGPILFCPRHRPDKEPGNSEYGCSRHSCGVCAGRREAAHRQAVIEACLIGEGRPQ